MSAARSAWKSHYHPPFHSCFCEKDAMPEVDPTPGFAPCSAPIWGRMVKVIFGICPGIEWLPGLNVITSQEDLKSMRRKKTYSGEGKRSANPLTITTLMYETRTEKECINNGFCKVAFVAADF